MKVVILGAGGHGFVVGDIISSMKKAGVDVEVVGYLDDNCRLWGLTVGRWRVLGSTSKISNICHDAAIVAIGDNRVRMRFHQLLKDKGETFFLVIHPRSVVAESVSIGPGSMICAGAVINPATIIGEGVIVNTEATVDHHNHLGSFVHIAPGAHLGGGVTVEEGALVGIGATVLPGIKIGAWSVVEAAAVVNRDVPPKTVVVGNPARIVKSIEL